VSPLSDGPGGGWTGVEAGAQERVASTELQAFLRANIYDGHSAEWRDRRAPAARLSRNAVLLAVVIAIRRRSTYLKKSRAATWKKDEGPELISAAEWNTKLQPDGLRLQLDTPTLLGQVQYRLLGRRPASLGIRRNLESSHILIMGDSGSGKTSACARSCVRSPLGRKQQSFTIQPLSSHGSSIRQSEATSCLNPLDGRCPYWDIADESESDDANAAMGAALFPDKDFEKEYFTDAPRRVFTFLMRRRPSPQSADRMDGQFGPNRRDGEGTLMQHSLIPEHLPKEGACFRVSI